MNKKRETTMDHVLSLVFRIGLSLALATVIYGAVILLWQHGRDEVDYLVFDGQPAYLKTFWKIFFEALTGNALSIIQLGILMLIATPVVRVISCLILFAIERDLLYVILSAVVLGVLLYANL
jgi:uncharacterized membrane protein